MIRQSMNNFYQQGQSQMDSQRTRVGYLLQLMEYVCSNAAYSRFIDEKMLVQWRSYFDICQLIFSELSIKIIKIQENPNTSPALKLHHLITLLYQELQVEQLRTIDARQVLAFNIDHIHRLLQILYLYSKIYLESKRPTTVVKSQTEEKQKQKPAFSSARDNRKSQSRVNDDQFGRRNQEQYGQDEQESTHRKEPSSKAYHRDSRQNYSKQEDYLIKQKHKKNKGKPTYSVNKKRARSQSAQRKNLHQGIVNVIMGEKSNLLRASTRNNRKSRLESVKLAKDSYKMYLTRYTKENNANFKRKNHLRQKTKAKPLSQQLPEKDFLAIDNYFESFAYRFRDKKAAYLQRIQKLVRQQELNRFLHQNRLQRELKQSMSSHLEGELNKMAHQHRVKSAFLRQTSSALDQNTSTIIKAIKQRNNIQRRELKQTKRQQLKAIQNALRQQNEKVLMSLEEGGRLEQIIMQTYKRF